MSITTFGEGHYEKRYWFAILCSVLVLAALLPFTMRASIAEGETSGQCGDDLYWSFDQETGTLTITGSGDMWDYAYDTQPWADFRETIASVNLPDGITSIGDYAFYYCFSLEFVTIPDSVTRIGNCAFFQCNMLNSITIPNGVISIGRSAFAGCIGITEFFVPGSVTSIDWGVFQGCKISEFAVSPNNNIYTAVDGVLLTKDMEYLLAYPKERQQTNYTIPTGVAYIYPAAFYGCHHLSTVVIPDSVIVIGQGAFVSCTGLTKVTIPKNVTEIRFKNFLGELKSDRDYNPG